MPIWREILPLLRRGGKGFKIVEYDLQNVCLFLTCAYDVWWISLWLLNLRCEWVVSFANCKPFTLSRLHLSFAVAWRGSCRWKEHFQQQVGWLVRWARMGWRELHFFVTSSRLQDLGNQPTPAVNSSMAFYLFVPKQWRPFLPNTIICLIKWRY